MDPNQREISAANEGGSFSAPVSAPQHYDLIGRRTPTQTRRIYRTALALAIAGGIYLAVTNRAADVMHVYIGLAIYAAAVWPGLVWLKQGGSRFPVFEPMMALCVNAYAVPLLAGHEGLRLYPENTVTLAGIAALAYVLTAIFTYRVTGGRPGRSPFWTESILNDSMERFVPYSLIAAAAYNLITAFSDVVPYELESVLRAVFNGLSVLSTFIACQRWGRGELRAGERWLFGITIGVQALVTATSLMLVGAFALIGIATLGYLSAGKRLPWLAIVVTFTVAAILHNGKAAMREIYWEGETRERPAIGQVFSFYSQWFEFGLQTPVGDSPDEKMSKSARLLDRASLMHILTMVVHYTPERQPYLYGETYSYVLPQLIPRFFWPDKPRSHIASYRLAINYGLQTEESTRTTTIAFGMPPEAYANFGLFGMAALGALSGFVFKRLQTFSLHSPMFSLAGIMMILLTAWSFNAEMTMAVWVSSLYQALIAALGIPFVIRRLLGD